MQFELILARQIPSGSRGHVPMIFMPKMLYILIVSVDILKHFFNKNVAKNLLKYNNLKYNRQYVK